MKKILLTSLLALGVGVTAQVTGTKTVGTEYATLADALTDLNTNGVGTGGVIINVPAGFTETAPSGGYILGTAALNATLSSANPIVIQKSGSGSNPLLTANTGQSSNDAIFVLNGADYVTIDGIDLTENSANITAATSIAFTEIGYGLFNLSATDGSQYNTIKNSTITFLRRGAIVSNGPIGINAVAATYSNGTTTAVTLTNATGAHSYNKIYSNAVKRPIGYGIYFSGSTTAAYFQTGNDVGGNSASTGNTITDLYGETYTTATNVSGYAAYATGIFLYNQNGANASFNTVTTGVAEAAVAGNLTTLGNVGIYFFGTGAFSGNNNNITLRAQSYSSGTFAGVYSGSTGALTANNNVISAEVPTVFSGSTGVYGINSASTGAFTATGNNINIGVTQAAAYGISSSSTLAVNITDNVISGLKPITTAYGIYLAVSGTTANLLRNKVYNFEATGTSGAAHGIYVAANTASSTLNIANNLIGDLRTPSASATTVSLSGIYFAASTNTSNYNVYYNSIYLNGTSSGANFNSSGIYHTYTNGSTISVLDLRDNIISNLSTPNGTGTASAFRRSSATNLLNYAATSNNNDFAVGSAGFVYYNGTTKYNFTTFKELVTTRETNSLNFTPTFTSVSGTDAGFLKLNVNAPTTQDLDNKGADITGYTTDYAGTVRNTPTPDIGAYEFTYAAPTVVPVCTTVSSPTSAATGVTPNPATLSWSTATGATSYKVYIGTTSGGTDIVNGAVTSDLNYNITLAVNTTYYAKVVASNNIGDATGCSEISFTTGNVVYCTAGASTADEKITNVSFSDIANATTNTSNYINTGVVGKVNREGVYPITVSNLPAYSADLVYVWIDYNQDGTFDETTEKTALAYTYSGSSSATSSSAGSITIPSTAKLGTTRMRVRLNYTTSGGNSTPCGNSSYGEVEDYNIEISPSTTLAVSDLNKAGISVYPNPFTDVLRISDVKGIESISVNDMTGRQVKSLAPSAEINLSNLQGGLYIINLKMVDGSVKSFKAIKK